MMAAERGQPAGRYLIGKCRSTTLDSNDATPMIRRYRRAVASRWEEANRLLAGVAAERSAPMADRTTRASDADLAKVTELLEAAARAETPAERIALRGRISRLVADMWSFEASLSDELVAFDDRFMCE